MLDRGRNHDRVGHRDAQLADDATRIDLVTDGHGQLFDDAAVRRRNIHGRLVRFQGDQAVFLVDDVARRHEQLDDFDVFEVAQVGYHDVDDLRHGREPTASPDRDDPGRCRISRSPAQPS